MNYGFVFSALLVIILAVLATAKDGGLFEKRDSDFFLRSAKWAQFPSGGSLVSGRGGFRPGFNSQNGWRQFVYDFRK
ncbi:hypothetical protein WR25_10918 isoform B [Diploscapter pachys]|uniref:Uncharacterized protein n=1 Tax=Diploscapter pachys TaxID=2018661 RepID=A0A2A2K7V9_9BILA|nr:hypothetical protein WR25_10918 isoform B [Diploscapter pachys]